MHVVGVALVVAAAAIGLFSAPDSIAACGGAHSAERYAPSAREPSGGAPPALDTGAPVAAAVGVIWAPGLASCRASPADWAPARRAAASKQLGDEAE